MFNLIVQSINYLTYQCDPEPKQPLGRDAEMQGTVTPHSSQVTSPAAGNGGRWPHLPCPAPGLLRFPTLLAARPVGGRTV